VSQIEQSIRERLCRCWFGQQGDRCLANVAGLNRPRHLMHWPAATFDVDVSGGSRLPAVPEAGRTTSKSDSSRIQRMPRRTGFHHARC
jgi:hypothetical protein